MSSDDVDDIVCRICLESCTRDEVIAPCRCSGSSKWVHRECLNQWRTVREDKAFASCTECLTRYVLVPPPSAGTGTGNDSVKARQWRFSMLVWRDLLSVFLLAHVPIACFSLVMFWVDEATGYRLARFFHCFTAATTAAAAAAGHRVVSNSAMATALLVLFYYLCGWVCLFEVAGLAYMSAQCCCGRGPCSCCYRNHHMSSPADIYHWFVYRGSSIVPIATATTSMSGDRGRGRVGDSVSGIEEPLSPDDSNSSRPSAAANANANANATISSRSTASASAAVSSTAAGYKVTCGSCLVMVCAPCCCFCCTGDGQDDVYYDDPEQQQGQIYGQGQIYDGVAVEEEEEGGHGPAEGRISTSINSRGNNSNGSNSSVIVRGASASGSGSGRRRGPHYRGRRTGNRSCRRCCGDLCANPNPNECFNCLDCVYFPMYTGNDCAICCSSCGDCCSCCSSSGAHGSLLDTCGVFGTNCCDAAAGGGAMDCCTGASLGEECLFAAVILAVVVLVVGLVVMVLMGGALMEMVLLKHVHILQKRTLVEQYQVLDLCAEPNPNLHRHLHSGTHNNYNNTTSRNRINGGGAGGEIELLGVVSQQLERGNQHDNNNNNITTTTSNNAMFPVAVAIGSSSSSSSNNSCSSNNSSMGRMNFAVAEDHGSGSSASTSTSSTSNTYEGDDATYACGYAPSAPPLTHSQYQELQRYGLLPAAEDDEFYDI